MAAIRVLITDDHLIVREGLRMILGGYPDIHVVGEAENGFQAIELAEETHPDLILMDLRMPGMDGLAAIARIKAQWPEIAIVILTTYHEDDLMIRSLQAGAQGFLLKDTNCDTLVDTIQAALRGAVLMRPDTLRRLLPKTERTPAQLTEPFPKYETDTRTGARLSPREVEVLRLVAKGGRNKEIARQLTISQSTVKAHLDSIFNKLGVDSRTAAVSMAFRLDLLADRV